MEALQQQLAQLTPEQVRQLLGASGHAELLQTQQRDAPPPASEAASEQAEQAKQRGNECFRKNEFALAIEAYSTAVALDPRNAVCLSNRAAAHLKLEDYRSAIDDCSKAIDITASIKPFMRRAAARIELEEFADAVRDLVAALSFEPNNKECVTKLSKIARLYAESSSGDPQKVDRRTCIKAALSVATRDGWKVVAVKGNPAPPALNGHTLFRGADRRIMLFGGRSVRDQKPQVYALDAHDFSWDVASMSGAPPTPRAWHSISCIGNAAEPVMLVYGGVSSQGEDPRVYLLSPVANGCLRWSQPQRIEGEAPSPRSGHSAVGILRSGTTSGETFIFGGRTKRGVSDSMYIIRTSKTGDEGFECAWDEVARVEPWPRARDGHTMCALASTANDSDLHGAATPKLVLFGGNGQQNEEKMSDAWIFDTESGRWQELECTGEIPPPRSYHTAHMIGACMFVVGGRMRDAEDAEVYMLDTESREWFHVPMPEKAKLSARAWHSSIATDELRIFLLGGGTFNGPRKDAALLDLSKFAALMTTR